MIIGVIADGVSPAPHFGQKFRMTMGIFAYHKKGGLGIKSVQLIKYPRSSLGNGTIVEG